MDHQAIDEVTRKVVMLSGCRLLSHFLVVMFYIIQPLDDRDDQIS